MSERGTHEKILVFLLRLSGCATLIAFPTALLPVEWMAAAHRWFGMGELPESAVVDYMARSLSLLYGSHGGMMLVVSTNVRRYAGVVTYLALMYALLGPAMLAIDLHAGMPQLWTLGEGPPIFLLGLLMLWLQRSVPRD